MDSIAFIHSSNKNLEWGKNYYTLPKNKYWLNIEDVLEVNVCKLQFKHNKILTWKFLLTFIYCIKDNRSKYDGYVLKRVPSFCKLLHVLPVVPCFDNNTLILQKIKFTKKNSTRRLLGLGLP